MVSGKMRDETDLKKIETKQKSTRIEMSIQYAYEIVLFSPLNSTQLEMTKLWPLSTSEADFQI